MIFDWIRRQADLGDDEGRAYFGGDLFQRVAMIAKPLLAEVAIEAGRVARCVNGLARAGCEVLRLNDSNAATRIQAGQQVVEALRGARSADLIDALVMELEGGRLQELSASERFNALYMLNVYDSWSNSQHAARLSAALARIEARETEGVRIGAQTQDCVDRLKRKLAGEANVGDRCGRR